MSGPVTSQPGHKLFPSSTEWGTGWSQSCSPISQGIVYCLCGPCCTGRLLERTGENYWACCCSNATTGLRTKVRMAYGIKGSLINDCLATLIGPCAILQIKKELDRQGVSDPFAK